MWYWHRHDNIDQWKRTKNPGINSYIYGELIFMSIKNIKWGGKTVFFYEWYGIV